MPLADVGGLILVFREHMAEALMLKLLFCKSSAMCDQLTARIIEWLTANVANRTLTLRPVLRVRVFD